MDHPANSRTVPPRGLRKLRPAVWAVGAWPGVAAAVTPSTPEPVAGLGGGMLFGLGVVALGAMVVWQTVRRAAWRKRQIESVLEHAEGLLWCAVVTLRGDDWTWEVKLEPSGLARRLYGQLRPPEGGRLWSRFDVPELPEMDRRCRAALEGGQDSYEQEFELRNGGRRYWLHENVSITPLGVGRFSLVGLVTDVTHRRESERERREGEERLQQLLSRSDCLLWQAEVTGDPEQHTEWAWYIPDSELYRRLGGTHDPEPHMPWDRSLIPEYAEINARATQALREGAPGYGQEFRLVKDNAVIWLREQVSIKQVGHQKWRLEGMIVDQTAQRKAEEAKRASDEQLQQVLQTADFMLWHARVFRTSEGHYHWVQSVPNSTLYRRVFGDDPGQPQRMRWVEVVSPEENLVMMWRAEKAFETGAQNYEQEIETKRGGQSLWLHEQATVRPVAPGEWQVVGVVTDVTKRKLAEAARHGSERALREILERANCLLWRAQVVRRGGELVWEHFEVPASRLFAELRGGGNAPFESAGLWEFAKVPELAEMNTRSTSSILAGRSGYEQEFHAQVAGRTFWLHEHVSIVSDGTESWRLVGVITDITARREAESQLQRILEQADCMVWEARVQADASGTLDWTLHTTRSVLYRRLFGDSESDPALDWRRLEVPELADMARRAREAVLQRATGYAQEFRVIQPGQVLWMREVVTISEFAAGLFRLVGVITDITAQRAAEQSLRNSERRYRTLFQHTPIAILEADFMPVVEWLDELRRSGVVDLVSWLEADPKRAFEAARRVRVLDCNDTAMTMLRARTRADFRRRRGVLASPDTMRWVREMALAIWQGSYRLEAEIEMFDFEGGSHRVNLRWWMEQEGGARDHPQSVVVLVDLTDLKRAEAALAAEKERLAVTLRAMAEGVVTTDVDGRVQFMNEAAAALTGYRPGETIGRAVGEVCRFENQRTGEAVDVPVARVARGDVVIELPAGTRMIAQDGAGKLVEGCCAPVHSAASRVIGTVLVFRDVTEHERLEQELVRATKLESVGILAGGIAHDFNNILTAIMGNTALAALDIDPKSDAGRSLAEAEKATLRARDLTQQLLTFAKGGEPVCTAVKLDGVVREVVTFTLHGSKVRAHFDVPSNLWAANADKGQIGRVVQNLVLNAVQAMPDGGTVRIVLANELVAGLAQAALAPGNYVRIEIRDTGVGIKPEHLSRIFDPYFTTKQTGSGLGLAAVYSIVHKHHGTIEVESQLGLGSVFRLWLPASVEVAVGAGEGRPAAPVVMKGRVLFMDDEEPIRHMATFLLRRLGFEVVGAVDGADAIEKYRAALAEGQSFTLVIMDLTIPGGMGGKEAITHLQKLDPQVRAIVSSGYSSDPVLANFRANGFCGVVAKPYEIGELARVLREALAAVVK